MQSKLRELAARWRRYADDEDSQPEKEGAYIESLRICAAELLSILDAEGDGGAVTSCCGRSECGGECGNEWNGMVPVPRPARSGGVSDADVEAVIKSVERANTDGMDGDSWDRILVRAALEHFAKVAEVGGDTPELFAGTADQRNALSVRLPAEDSQWCNTHGMIHSVELADGDCTFPDLGEKP